MKILAVTPEIFPLVKTGGLADVTGALPGALAAHGISVRSLVPGYPSVMSAFKKKKPLHSWASLYGGKVSVYGAEISGLDILVLDAPHLFDRMGGPYGDATGADWPDNWRRFAAFGRAAADIARGAIVGYRPNIVHAHDWQAALALAYLRYGPQPAPPSVMTVHNLAFQGQFAGTIFPELGLPPQAMALDGIEYYGGVGFLKGGLQAASAITTVSPTYAQEIRTPAFGMGLDGLLNLRSANLHGIVNGIDVETWNPATDKHLPATYSAKTLAARRTNKKAVEQRFNFAHDTGPIFCVVSRLTWQKGMDVLVSILDSVIGLGARIAILGAGDGGLEGALLAAASRHKGRVGVVIGYDEGLSHLLQGGSDGILIPSRFEPCGLTQLYGLRYGCVPIVARTGGLADTIIDANEAALSAGVATGFQFAPESGEALFHAIRNAIAAFSEPSIWAGVQKQGMKADVSWDRSAAKYAEIYRSLISQEAS
ncbi:glycogen synthase GlgA [Mesorhizobium sp. SB112]|uniref:glycogen synthase GlgA n=1 Tax=Mesorhizobium sp. SB112 TaxID=3151853 RepID=UPI003263BC36